MLLSKYHAALIPLGGVRVYQLSSPAGHRMGESQRECVISFVFC